MHSPPSWVRTNPPSGVCEHEEEVMSLSFAATSPSIQLQTIVGGETAVERIWHEHDSQGRILAVAFGLKSLNPFKFLSLRSTAFGAIGTFSEHAGWEEAGERVERVDTSIQQDIQFKSRLFHLWHPRWTRHNANPEHESAPVFGTAFERTWHM